MVDFLNEKLYPYVYVKTTDQGKDGCISFLVEDLSTEDNIFSLGTISNNLFAIRSNNEITSFPDLSTLTFVHAKNDIKKEIFYEIHPTHYIPFISKYFKTKVEEEDLCELYLDCMWPSCYKISPMIKYKQCKENNLKFMCKLPSEFEHIFFMCLEPKKHMLNNTIHRYNDQYVEIKYHDPDNNPIDDFKCHIFMYDSADEEDFKYAADTIYKKIRNLPWEIYDDFRFRVDCIIKSKKLKVQMCEIYHYIRDLIKEDLDFKHEPTYDTLAFLQNNYIEFKQYLKGMSVFISTNDLITDNKKPSWFYTTIEEMIDTFKKFSNENIFIF